MSAQGVEPPVEEKQVAALFYSDVAVNRPSDEVQNKILRQVGVDHGYWMYSIPQQGFTSGLNWVQYTDGFTRVRAVILVEVSDVTLFGIWNEVKDLPNLELYELIGDEAKLVPHLHLVRPIL